MKIVQVESLGVSKQELDEAKQEFEKLGHQYIYYTDIPKGEDELIARMKDAAGLVTSPSQARPEAPRSETSWRSRPLSVS